MAEPEGLVGVQRRHAAMARRSRRRLAVTIFVLGDAGAILFALLSATYLRFGRISEGVRFENSPISIEFWQLSLFVVPIFVVALAISGMYDVDRITWNLAEVGRITRSLSLGLVALILGTYLLKLPGMSRAWTLLAWGLSIGAVIIVRLVSGLAVEMARRGGRFLRPAIVVGSNAEAADIIRVLSANPGSGIVPVGCLAATQADRLELDYCSQDIPVLGAARDILEVLDQTSVDTVIIASSAFDHEVLARMIAELKGADVDLHISSGLFEVLTSRVLVNEIAGVPLITVRSLSLSPFKLGVKRTFDVAVATLVTVIGAPLWIALALGVLLTSRGPILYRQERVGRGGRRFHMYKFRSMYCDADERLAELGEANEATGPLFKMKSDPRVTPVGKWLRKFSMDEIPQLINVFAGDMSLVGPRPPLPHEVESYDVQAWRRLEVVPGMTGMWQVSGRSALTFEEMVRLDLFYIENWSVTLDLAIILRTVPAVLLARGAY